MQGPNDALPFKLNDEPVRSKHSFPAAYQLTHVATGDVYVGSTHDLYTRINKHKTSLSVGQHRNHRLQGAHDTSPEFRVDYCPTNTREEALDLEQSLLDDLRLCDNVLNIAMDARKSGLGVVRSTETREKLREANRRQFSSESVRQAHSEKTQALWSDPEYRAKHTGYEREADTCRPGALAFRDKMDNDPEFRARMIASRSTPTTYQGVEYPSLKAAAEATGLSASTIRYRVNKPSK